MAMEWLILFVLAIIRPVLGARLPDLYWNASNPIFRIDNTDHIIDVNKGNVAYEYDQVNIICPMYSTGTRENDVERYIIYNVSKEEYDSCRITNERQARMIANCDTPFKQRYFTITFRPFTPQPGGLEFKPGQDYYFISLSPNKSQENAECATHHTKVVFKICCKNNVIHKLSPPSRTTPSPANITLPSVSVVLLNKTSNNFTTTHRPHHRWTQPTRTSLINVISNGDKFINNHHQHNHHHQQQNQSNITSNKVPHDQIYRIRGKNGLNYIPNSINNNSIYHSVSSSTPSPNHHHQSSSQSPFNPVSSTPSTAPTPYWWRPHFTKIPSHKTNAKNSELVNTSAHLKIDQLCSFIVILTIIKVILS